MNEQRVLNEIVPLLKQYIELSDKDRETTKELVKELREVVKENRDCVVAVKLQIERLKTHSEMLDSNCGERKTECGKKHDVFASQLSNIPSKESSTELNNVVKTLSNEMRNLTIKVYVVIGVCAGVFGIIKWGLPFFLSIVNKTGG